jgi:hypothetical protein
VTCGSSDPSSIVRVSGLESNSILIRLDLCRSFISAVQYCFYSVANALENGVCGEESRKWMNFPATERILGNCYTQGKILHTL